MSEDGHAEGEGVMDMDEFKRKADELNDAAKDAGFESTNSLPPSLDEAA